MAKLRCDRRVKWRNTSSSPSSGNPAISSRSNPFGMASRAGTSADGQQNPLRPGEPLSKISRGAALRTLRLPSDGSDKALDLLSLVHFGDADEQAIFQFRVPLAQSRAGYDFLRGTPRQQAIALFFPNNTYIQNS